MVDDGPNDPSPPNPAPEAGRIAGGWSLNITTTDMPVTNASAGGIPPPRGRAAIAFHPPSGKVVLYGGTQELQIGRRMDGTPTAGGAPFRPLADTWVWDPAPGHGANERPSPPALVSWRQTSYAICMTMLSFRLDDEEAKRVQAWADRLGVDRSELLREALRRHLLRLASENDATTWAEQPLEEGEQSLAAIADWGPAEDWSDWADAAR